MSDLDLDEFERWEASGTSKPLDLAIRDIHVLVAEVRALRERVATLEGERDEARVLAKRFMVERSKLEGGIERVANNLIDAARTVEPDYLLAVADDLRALLDASHDQELCVVCGHRTANAGTCGPCERAINTPHDQERDR